jgi:DNA polymerase-3 subunit epsilon
LYCIVDIETTGGTARNERITEIAIVVHDGQQVTDTFSTLINPERSIPWNITQLTGITNDMVADAPRFYEVARKIVEMTEGKIFVAHNVNFDYSFVREEFSRLGFEFSRKVFPGLPSYSLSNLKNHFGIHAERSHRALDDTLATTRLFEMMLESGSGTVRDMVNKGVKETRLPAGLTIERLHEAPEACGVYYLHDDSGHVIYVGKSINIRKRLFEHFSDMTQKGEKMRQGVADFSWEVMGSELVALLHESAEIKRLQPRINKALRLKQYQGALYSYTDENGYFRLAFGKNSTKNAKKLQLVATYPKLEHARAHLQSVVKQLELCYRLCHLDASEHACFHHSIKQCHGACIGQEMPDSYNERVELALKMIDRRLQGSYLLTDRGRDADELAVVAVINGVYKGFCFINRHQEPPAIPDLLSDMRNADTKDPSAAHIIHSWTEAGKCRKIDLQQ